MLPTSRVAGRSSEEDNEGGVERRKNKKRKRKGQKKSGVLLLLLLESPFWPDSIQLLLRCQRLQQSWEHLE